jgi:pimeloyl-ACP methyl ester carboxylesterase
MPQALKDAFLRVNPDERALRRMHDKDAARMRSFCDVPDDAVRSVRAPTLIVVGDRDIVRPEHAVRRRRHRRRDSPRVPRAELTAQLIEQFLGDPGR